MKYLEENGGRLQKVSFERVETFWDENLQQKQKSSVKDSKVIVEQDYVKLYAENACLFPGIDTIPFGIFRTIFQLVNGYNNKENTFLTFRSCKASRDFMSNELSISENMISKYVNKLVKMCVLIPTNERGLYVCNPWIIGRGSWSKSIHFLRRYIKPENGTWVCDVDFE